MLKGEKKLSFSHSLGKIVGKLQVEDPDKDQSSVKYKLVKSDDKDHFKITRSGDIAFLRLPRFENPVDRNKTIIYNISYRTLVKMISYILMVKYWRGQKMQLKQR